MQDNQSETNANYRRCLIKQQPKLLTILPYTQLATQNQSDQGEGNKFKFSRKQPSTARAGIKYEKSNVQRLENY